MNTVLELLDEKVNSDKTIYEDESYILSYREFIQLSKKIASGIAKIGLYKNPILVLIHRDVISIELFFGIIYSGNFYVPIDPELPLTRINQIVKTLNAKCVLYNTNTDMKKIVDGLDIEEKIAWDKLVKSVCDENVLNHIRQHMIDTDPVYSIFTSGSTGVPKGVTICHRSLLDLVNQFLFEFKFDEDTVIGNQAPFDFDVSVKDIFMTIASGGRMKIIPKKLFTSPLKLVEFINENKINTAIWAVSALNIVSAVKTFEKIVPDLLTLVMFSGEAISNKVLNDWRKALPKTQFVNLYGPTEITCNCTYYKVDRKFADHEALPIGKAFRNSEVFLLDKGKLVEEENHIGEICVRGSSLALGYYNDWDKTTENFCQNPLNNHYPELIYRTGDIGYYNQYHELVYSSRKDFQIKHMGHRIELGEIELAVNSMDFIHSCCVLYHNDKIYLFYSAERECKKDIAKALLDILPKYMCPNVYEYLSEIPLNAHGKIDRKLLEEKYIK